jgi:transcriptional regulator GlxA family with amidase domain
VRKLDRQVRGQRPEEVRRVEHRAGRGHARCANTSPRNLGRQFRSVVGQTPLQWLLTQRVRRAQELLEATSETVEAIAIATGMGTATTLRRQFKRIVGVPPDSYRRSFRSANPA